MTTIAERQSWSGGRSSGAAAVRGVPRGNALSICLAHNREPVRLEIAMRQRPSNG